MSGWRCCDQHKFRWPGCEDCAEVQADAEVACRESGHERVLMPTGDAGRFAYKGIAWRCHRCGEWL